MKTSQPRHRPTSPLFVKATIVLGAILAPGALTAQARVLAIDDLRLEVGVSAPALSPDGKSVVVITSRPNYEDNRMDRTLVLVDIATGAQRNLTPSRWSVGRARWSPSGEQLAFVDAGRDGGQRQIYVLPMAGGEAMQVTHAKNDVDSFRWTSDGASLLYTVADVPKEREGEERHNQSFEVGDNSYTTRKAPGSLHLWRIAVAGGEAKRLTEGSESISDLAVSPDGRTVALRVKPHPHSGERRSVIRALDLISAEQRTLVSDVGGGDIWAFSPDGRFLIFSNSRGPESGFNPSGMFLQPIDGGAPIDATRQLDRDLGGAAWLPDGKSFLVTGPDLTHGAMWQQPLDGLPRQLDLGMVNASSVVVSRDGTVVFIGREPHRPSELYAMRIGQWAPKRLSDFNHAIASMRLGRVETIQWDGSDGFKENGVLVYPPDFQAGRRYPLVLNVHGGPMGTSTEAFNTFNQILAAHGWLVLSPNYRGSNNQGKVFQSAVINDAGDGPGRDVMSGIRAVKDLQIVDERRVAVSGWSYGGYMTTWLTSHYDGWTVAMAGAAVTDWFDWYSMADLNTWAGLGLGGSPFLNDNASNYSRQSPIAYAHKIRTPTLILSDVGDERVPISQSYKLYHALKDNGVEVKFIAYPVTGHFPPDPVHQRDLSRRWVEWIADHFNAVGGS